jgi:hypothetical protein
MFAANAYVLRPANHDDTAVLTLLARLDSQRTITGPALIGEVDGDPVAAIEIATSRVVADPFEPTAAIANQLRMRAAGLRSHSRRPTVRERIAAGLRPALAA